MSATHRVSIALCLLCAVAASAQTPSIGASATRLVLADFEGGEAWRAEERAGGDEGAVEVAVSLRAGAPADIEATESTRDLAGPVGAQQRILSIRLRFSRLTDAAVAIEPERPIPVGDGSLWVLSAWVASVNVSHDLYAAFLDSEGRPYAEVLMGRLDYTGWKRMSLAPALVQPPGELLWNGFVLRIDPGSIGPEPQYYYFDFVSASTVARAAGALP